MATARVLLQQALDAEKEHEPAEDPAVTHLRAIKELTGAAVHVSPIPQSKE